jgi:hypothetical protein
MQSPRGTRVQIAHERERVGCRALASQPGEYQLRIRIHSNERVLLAYFVGFFDGYTALPLLHEAMQFVYLNPPDLQILKRVTQFRVDLLRSEQEQAQDRIPVNASDALDAANAHSFNHEPENFSCFLDRNPHGIERCGVIFSERLAALVAAEALQAITMLPKFPAG